MTLEGGDLAAIRELVLRELRNSDLAVLVRQLQTGIYIHGQYAIAIGGLAANSVNYFDITTDRPLGTAWLPLGSIFYGSGGDAWTEPVNWSYTGVDADTFRVKVATSAGAPAAGSSIYFWVVSRA